MKVKQQQFPGGCWFKTTFSCFVQEKLDQNPKKSQSDFWELENLWIFK